MSKIQPMANGLRLNCLITGDNHIDIKHPFPKVPMYFLIQSLKDAASSENRMDAYITVGDITSHGSEENWALVQKCFLNIIPAKNIVITPGNHDTWSDDGYQGAMSRFFENTTGISRETVDKPYFFRVINGYYLIVLGSTQEGGCEANLDEEELQWFESTMEKAGKTGKPIFVFCHQSLNGKHGLPRTFDAEEKEHYEPFDGGIGKESQRVENTLKQYKNVYFFSGHSHMGLAGEKMRQKEGYASVEEDGELHLINLPSQACGNHHGECNAMGIGFVLEVYDDRVILRPRSCSRHRFVKKVLFKNDKHYYEARISK